MQNKFVRAIAPVATLMLGCVSTSAMASFVPSFSSASFAVAPNLTTVNYTLSFSTSGSSSETLTSGDFVTIYDVGPVGGFTTPAGISASSTLVGLTPAGITPTDFATVGNVTFTYTGATLLTDATFNVSYQIVGDFSGGTRSGQFGSTETLPLGRSSQIGPVAVATPEPGSFAAALALGGLLLGPRRA